MTQLHGWAPNPFTNSNISGSLTMGILETLVGTLSTALIGIFVWGVTLHSRVAVVETNIEGLAKLINSQFREVNRRLDRIENKLNRNLE
jgi:hypothetical protein